jgi:hypothetical protein
VARKPVARKAASPPVELMHECRPDGSLSHGNPSIAASPSFSDALDGHHL